MDSKMSGFQEVVVTSCLNDSVVSAYMWDAANGVTLMTYRGESPIAPVGLSLLAGQYVVAALQDKPFLRVWPVNSQQALSGTRLVCPGRVSHAQASPDKCYIAVTVAEKVHLYQLGSGRLLGTGSRHFQPITVMRWSRDGLLLVCGGEDGLLTVWPLANLASTKNAVEPRFVLSDHSLPVSDLVISAGNRPRLFSVSADRTCKIYDLALGTMLLNLVFDKMLTAVATSVLETQVFVGTDSGSVLQFALLSPPRHIEYHLTPEETAPVFSGHSGAVRSLSASHCGSLMLSASADSTVKIWHISSRQCLRTIQHKGPVTNAFFALRPAQLFENELKPSVVICDFKSASGVSETTNFIEVITEQTLHLCNDRRDDRLVPDVRSDQSAEVKSLQTEVDLLKSINAHLYKFTVENLLAQDKLTKPPRELQNQEATTSTAREIVISDDDEEPSTSVSVNSGLTNRKNEIKTVIKHSVPLLANSVSKNKKNKQKARNNSQGENTVPRNSVSVPLNAIVKKKKRTRKKKKNNMLNTYANN